MCAICSDGSGNGHRLKNIDPVRHRGEHFNPRLTGGNIRGFKGSTFHRKSGYDLQKKITIIYKKKLYNKSQTKTIGWHLFKQLKPDQGVHKLPHTLGELN